MWIETNWECNKLYVQEYHYNLLSEIASFQTWFSKIMTVGSWPNLLKLFPSIWMSLQAQVLQIRNYSFFGIEILKEDTRALWKFLDFSYLDSKPLGKCSFNLCKLRAAASKQGSFLIRDFLPKIMLRSRLGNAKKMTERSFPAIHGS